MTTWSKIWLIWLALVFVSFGVLEGLGASITAQDTLSDTWWKWFNVQPFQDPAHWTLPHLLAFAIVLIISVVLTLHLGLGLFR